MKTKIATQHYVETLSDWQRIKKVMELYGKDSGWVSNQSGRLEFYSDFHPFGSQSVTTEMIDVIITGFNLYNKEP